MRDPYEVLGIAKSADEAEVKRAFRKLAKALHPDRNTDDPKAKDKFAEVNAAYQILGDAEKRRRFDRGEIDREGKPRHPGFEGFGARPSGGFGAGAQGAEGFSFGFGANGPFARRGGAGGGGAGVDPSDLFSDLFGFGGGRRGGRGQQAGGDLRGEVSITPAEAVAGTSKRVSLPGGRILDVSIPAGVSDGQVVRLRGQGLEGAQGGRPGDAFIAVRVLPDPRFTVEGKDLKLRLAVTLEQAVLGGKVRCPTLEGTVEINVPPNSSTGRVLRLRGKGLPGPGGAGDLLAVVEIVLPPDGDAELEDFLRRRRERRG
jgi:DnaJ-class molecular chaperone